MPNFKIAEHILKLALVGLVPAPAFAEDIKFGPGYFDRLVVTFEAPVQHPSHHTISFSPAGWSTGFGSLLAEVSLYDEHGFLGGGQTQDAFDVYFSDPTSNLVRERVINVDFSRISDGVEYGRFEVKFVGGTEGAYIQFDPTIFSAVTFGRSGSYVTSQPTVIDVAWSVAAIPEPSTWLMLALGLCGIGLSRTRHRRA